MEQQNQASHSTWSQSCAAVCHAAHCAVTIKLMKTACLNEAKMVKPHTMPILPPAPTSLNFQILCLLASCPTALSSLFAFWMAWLSPFKLINYQVSLPTGEPLSTSWWRLFWLIPASNLLSRHLETKALTHFWILLNIITSIFKLKGFGRLFIENN